MRFRRLIESGRRAVNILWRDGIKSSAEELWIEGVEPIVSEAGWWLKHRFVPKHKYNTLYLDLPPGYYDEDVQMLYAAFGCLARFARTGGLVEGGIDWTDGSHKAPPEQMEAAKTLRALWKFWSEERPAREAVRKELAEKPSQWEQLRANEKEWEEQDQEALERLVKLREWLWT